jgi:predicted GNAT family N-acyltransferase
MGFASAIRAVAETLVKLFQNQEMTRSETCEIGIYSSLPQAYESQVNKLLKKDFGDYVNCNEGFFSSPYAHLLAIERGDVIGVIKLFSRVIVFEGKTVTIGGFGAVTTTREKRRMGVATALLKKGINDFRKQNFDIAFLCTDISNPAMTELYSKVGFVSLGRPHSFTGKSGTKYVEHNGMVAPVKSIEKFNSVLSGKENLDIGAGCW